MKLRLPSEFLYQVFALLFAVIVVHAAYVGVIRPSADYVGADPRSVVPIADR